ncbi:MAG: hypothetical protein QXJ61_02225 [Candidatus Nitrosocaldus sp.]
MGISKLLLLKMIPYMDGMISIKELSSLTGISNALCNTMIDDLVSNGVGSIEDEEHVRFTTMDKINAVILAMRLNTGMDEIARVLHWRDFEMLTAEMLEENGYTTVRNVRLRVERGAGVGRGSRSRSRQRSAMTMMEIDVVGIKCVNGENRAILLDCKHWQYMSPSELVRICEKQVARAVAFINGRHDVDHAIPSVIVLNDIPSIIDGVPIVPITRLREFLNDIYSIDNLHIVRRLEEG